MKYHALSALVATGLLIQSASVVAHGDESHDAIKKRDEFISQRSLAACKNNAKARALFERSFRRREDLINSVRRKRGLEARSFEQSHRISRRDFDTNLQTDHNGTFADVTFDVDSSVLFSGNTSCLLTPETTEGPYFVSGEYVRSDIRDGQSGVEMYLDVQIIDINTCEPIESAYLDAWHTNATGVYSGIVASGNGGGSDDPSNINNTFCRGVQFTDADGVVQFQTIFPGHYSGRTTHIHIMSHKGGEVYDNGTYSDTGTVTHVGQFFFDENLRTEVEKLEPYASNTQGKTSNEDDGIASSASDNDYDPFVEYAYLGDSVEDGLLTWITVGVDPEAEYDPSVAVKLTEEGGVAEGGDGMGNGGGNGGPSDAPPGGSQTGGPPGPSQTSDMSRSSSARTTTGTADSSAATTEGSTATSSTSDSTSTPGAGSKISPSWEIALGSILGALLTMF